MLDDRFGHSLCPATCIRQPARDAGVGLKFGARRILDHLYHLIMKISVTTADYSIIRQLDVDLNENIENVKALLEVEMGMPLAEQNLLFNGVSMLDDKTVRLYVFYILYNKG